MVAGDPTGDRLNVAPQCRIADGERAGAQARLFPVHQRPEAALVGREVRTGEPGGRLPFGLRAQPLADQACAARRAADEKLAPVHHLAGGKLDSSDSRVSAALAGSRKSPESPQQLVNQSTRPVVRSTSDGVADLHAAGHPHSEQGHDESWLRRAPCSHSCRART